MRDEIVRINVNISKTKIVKEIKAEKDKLQRENDACNVYMIEQNNKIAEQHKLLIEAVTLMAATKNRTRFGLPASFPMMRDSWMSKLRMAIKL